MASIKHDLNMTEGSIMKKIILFAIPLVFSNMLQIFYNAADIIVVSRWAGNEAMAAVGSTSSLNNLMVNVFVGISLGTSVIVSRCYGANDVKRLHRAVHTSIFIALVTGFVALILGELFCGPLLGIMGTPEGAVLDGARLYTRVICLGMPALLIYNFGAAIMRAVGDTKRPLYILAFTGLVNVILNLIFVINFNMSVVGVALATITSQYMSAAAVMYYLIRSDTSYRVNIKGLKIYKEEMSEILKMGIPAGVQGSVFSLSNMVIQSAVNSFGTAAIAGNSAGSNIEGFVYTAMNAFYQATITAVGQNYGAKNKKRVWNSMFSAMICTSVVGLALGLLTVFLKEPLLNIYIVDSPEAIHYGSQRIFLIGITYFLCGVMEVFTGTLRGLGYSSISAINSLFGVCLFRFLWVFTVLPHFRNIITLYACWPISWLIVIILHIIVLLVVKNRTFKRMYEQ